MLGLGLVIEVKIEMLLFTFTSVKILNTLLNTEYYENYWGGRLEPLEQLVE
jgi:hypothetical protein